MSDDARNEWTHGGDLQSYSFNDFYDKNEFPIPEEQDFDIDLTIKHLSFHGEPMVFDTRMETNQSEHCSHINRDIEDYFFQNEPSSPAAQLHAADGDSPPPQPSHEQRGEAARPRKDKKIKKPANPHKNQYDKNIFANINAVILKKMIMAEAAEELKFYCQRQSVCFEDFYWHFSTLQRKKFRLGTTELANFYESKQISVGWKQVFGMFSVRFLREEYLRYVLREGKMQEREKYLRCATKMMYIPRLRKEEYDIISGLMNKVVDI